VFAGSGGQVVGYSTPRRAIATWQIRKRSNV
jgi:hypothetical protein